MLFRNPEFRFLSVKKSDVISKRGARLARGFEYNSLTLNLLRRDTLRGWVVKFTGIL